MTHACNFKFKMSSRAETRDKKTAPIFRTLFFRSEANDYLLFFLFAVFFFFVAFFFFLTIRTGGKK